jgi:D-glycero-beta-D-manno-heptose-7-phosphate kinase
MQHGGNLDAIVSVTGAFAGKRVVVIGDLFLDEYVVGRVARVSREAPAMVLEFQRRYSLPGGATSPALNIRCLGGKAYQVGVVGEDDAGHQLRGVLTEAGVEIGGVVVDPDRPTTTKTRIVAEGFLVFPQQLVRIDRVDRKPVSGGVEDSIVAFLEARIPDADAILVSDYKTGVVSDRVIHCALEMSNRHGKLITVDSQGDLNKFSGFHVVKCNQQEAEAVIGHKLDSERDFELAVSDLRSSLRARAVLITRGADGMSFVEEGGCYGHIPVANRSEVFDVTGAGDAVIAVLTLGLCAGASLVDAAHLANCAAGVVVRKWGNATVSVDELSQMADNWARERP